MSDQTPLSERELEVLRLVAAGASNNDIAQRLIISPNTVKVHIRNIYSKLGVLSRTEASMEAIRRGLIVVPSGPNGEAPADEAADSPAAAAAPAADEAPPAALDKQAPPSAVTDHPIAPEAIEVGAADLAVVDPGASAVARDEFVAPTSISAVAADAGQVAVAAPSSAGLAGTASGRLIEQREARQAPADAAEQRIVTTHVAVPRYLAILIGGVLTVLVIAVAVIGWSIVRTSPPTTMPAAAPTTVPLVQDIWKPLPTLPQPVADAATVFYQNGIYVSGGSGAQGVTQATRRLDIVSRQWEDLADKPTAATEVGGVVVRQELYVPGGRDSNGKPLTTLEIYRFAEDAWRAGPDLPSPRAAYGLVALEGALYLLGGDDGTGPLSSTLIFDPDVGAWTDGPALPIPLSDAAVAQDGNAILVIGGRTTGGAANLKGWRYHEGAWSDLGTLPEPRINATLAVVADLIFLIGGGDTDLPILEYQSGVWAPRELTTGYPLSRQMLVVNRPTIYLLGGRNATTTLAEVREWVPTRRTFVPQIQK